MCNIHWVSTCIYVGSRSIHQQGAAAIGRRSAGVLNSCVHDIRRGLVEGRRHATHASTDHHLINVKIAVKDVKNISLLVFNLGINFV